MTPPPLAPPGETEVDAAERVSRLAPLLRWRNALAPFPRAGLFYARSWSNWLRHRGSDGVPAAFPSLLLMGHAFADEAVIAGFRVMKAPSPRSALVRAEVEAQAALELYGEMGFFADPASFHTQ